MSLARNRVALGFVLLMPAAAMAQPVEQDHASAPVAPSQPATTPVPGPTLARPTDEQIAAAFPELHGMDMASHMREDPWITTLRVDRIERSLGGTDGSAWALHVWSGRTRDRLWLRSHGARDGHGSHGNIDLLWGHATGPWWDRMIGLSRDFGGGRQRDWIALGVHGHAPYKFDAEATAFVGQDGRLKASASVGYDFLLSNHTLLRPEISVTAHSRDDPALGVGRGLSDTTAGLRLRHEFGRHFAPYVGWEWSGAHGESARLKRQNGEPASEHRWVAGVRFWF